MVLASSLGYAHEEAVTVWAKTLGGDEDRTVERPGQLTHAVMSNARRPMLIGDNIVVGLLFGIVVLGLVVAIVGPRLYGQVSKTKQAIARAQIELMGSALQEYRRDTGAYPPHLDALTRNPGGDSWNGPYLKKPVPNDPWGNPYKYRCCPSQHGDFDLWSEGSDDAPGGEGEAADVVSWRAAR